MSPVIDRCVLFQNGSILHEYDNGKQFWENHRDFCMSIGAIDDDGGILKIMHCTDQTHREESQLKQLLPANRKYFNMFFP